MNQNLLKSWLLMLLMLVGVGHSYADTEKITFSEEGYLNQETVESVVGTKFSITFDKGTNSNTPKYYTSGSAIRAYGGNTFTVSSDETFSKVVITFGSSDGSNAITVDSGDYSNGTWTGSESSVKFTIGGSTGNRRISAVEVTFGTIVVDPNAPGTQNNPYTVAQACAAIDANAGITNVYVSGIVSQVDSYNSSYHSVTYWISDDGTTSNQMEVYSGKGINGANFSSKDDIQEGDIVVVYGTLKKYNSIYEFNYNNELVSLDRPVTKQSAGLAYETNSYTVTMGDAFATPALTNPNNLTVTYSSSKDDVVTVDPSTGALTIVGIGNATITASFAGDDTYYAGSAYYTIKVNAAPEPRVSVDAEGNITFDLSVNDWGFPTSNTVTETSYVNSGYTLKVAGSEGNGFRFMSNCLFLGKLGAYVVLPAFDFAVEKIDVVGKSGASTKVTQNIYVGETEVSTETTGVNGVTNTYEIDEAYQAAGNVYVIKVTNANNSQITSIKVYKKAVVAPDPTTPDPETPAIPDNVKFQAQVKTGTIDVTARIFNDYTAELTLPQDNQYIGHDVTVSMGFYGALGLGINTGESRSFTKTIDLTSYLKDYLDADYLVDNMDMVNSLLDEYRLDIKAATEDALGYELTDAQYDGYIGSLTDEEKVDVILPYIDKLAEDTEIIDRVAASLGLNVETLLQKASELAGMGTAWISELLDPIYGFNQTAANVKVVDGKKKTGFKYTVNGVKEGGKNTKLVATPDVFENAQAAWSMVAEHMQGTTQEVEDSKMKIVKGTYVQFGDQRLKFIKDLNLFDGGLSVSLTDLDGLKNTATEIYASILDAVEIENTNMETTQAANTYILSAYMPKGSDIHFGSSVLTLKDDCRVELDAKEAAAQAPEASEALAQEITEVRNLILNSVGKREKVKAVAHYGLAMFTRALAIADGRAVDLRIIFAPDCDVNRDGRVTSNDVPALVNNIIGKDTENKNDHETNIDGGESTVQSVGDLTKLINVLKKLAQ